MEIFLSLFGFLLLFFSILFFIFWREEKLQNTFLQKDRDFWLEQFKKETYRHHDMVMKKLEAELGSEQVSTTRPHLVLVKGGLNDEDSTF